MASSVTDYKMRQAELEGRPKVESEADSWKKYRISLAKEYHGATPVLFRNDGEQFLHLGDIQMLDGPSGCRKTMLVCAMMAGMLYDGEEQEEGKPIPCLGFYSPSAAENRVLYIDTEQQENDTQYVGIRASKMAGLSTNEDDERFYAINLRGQDFTEKLKETEAAIRGFRPTAVFLDNIKDLGSDMNNVEESQRLVSLAMRLSTECNCAIMCIIHQNPGSEKPRGHIGTLLLEKVRLRLKLSPKDENRITQVDCSKARGMAFNQPFSFSNDEHGIPFLVDNQQAKARSYEKLAEAFTKIMEPGKSYGNAELCNLLVKLREGGNPESYKKRWVKPAFQFGIIKKDAQGGYYRPIEAVQQSIVDDNGSGDG